MIEPNDIGKRSQEIHLLVAEDNVPQAVKRLMDFIRDFSEDNERLKEVTVISASYHRLEKLERRGTLSFEKTEQQRNTILFRMLDLLHSVQEQLAYKIAS